MGIPAWLYLSGGYPCLVIPQGGVHAGYTSGWGTCGVYLRVYEKEGMLGVLYLLCVREGGMLGVLSLPVCVGEGRHAGCTIPPSLVRERHAGCTTPPPPMVGRGMLGVLLFLLRWWVGRREEGYLPTIPPRPVGCTNSVMPGTHPWVHLACSTLWLAPTWTTEAIWVHSGILPGSVQEKPMGEGHAPPSGPQEC